MPTFSLCKKKMCLGFHEGEKTGEERAIFLSVLEYRFLCWLCICELSMLTVPISNTSPLVIMKYKLKEVSDNVTETTPRSRVLCYPRFFMSTAVMLGTVALNARVL